MAALTYTIQRIGVPSTKLGTDAVFGTPIDTNAILYASPSGNVVGNAAQYFNNTPFSSGEWYFNGTTSFTIGLTSATYQKSSRGNNVATSSYIGLGNSRIYNNGYVTGISQRYDSAGTSLGADVWIFNGNGATPTTPSVAIPLPSTVIVPSAVTGVSSSNLAYSAPSQNSPNNGGTLEQMGGSSGAVQTGTHGNAAGQVTLYYNSTGTTWSSTATDAWYFDGTTTKTIGFVDGNNVNAISPASPNKFTRSSFVTRLNNSDQVLGYSSYFGGAATAAATGSDIWLYDPNNATGAGANGTILLDPPSVNSNVYAGVGSSGAAPSYLTDSGIVAAQFEQFAPTDTARATTLGIDTYLYNTHTTAYTQVGLTAANNSVYTFYSGTGSTAKTGYGGSSFAPINFSYDPGVNESGQAAGTSIRTAPGATPVTLGKDAWVYYPTANVPSGGSAGTTQVGLIGANSSVYETNTGTGVTRSSSVTALTASGAVVGTSTRYINNTVTTSAGTDAWIYDPAHGITSTKQIGLFGTSNSTPTDTLHEYLGTATGTTNITRNSAINATGINGMIAGNSTRYTSAGASEGTDAWVFDPITNKTYNIDPNAPATASASTPWSSIVTSISDSGLVLGYDGAITNTGSPAYDYSAFEWYLSYDNATSLFDLPTFQYLTGAVDPNSLSNAGFTTLNTTPSFNPFVNSSGDIFGLGGQSADSGTSYVPFEITPVPEPLSLGLLMPGAAMMLARRNRKSRNDQ